MLLLSAHGLFEHHLTATLLGLVYITMSSLHTSKKEYLDDFQDIWNLN